MKPFALLLVVCACRLVFASLGDVNKDGKVTLDDCKAIAAAVATGTAANLPLADADVDGDKTVTILDAMRLHQNIGGLWLDPSGTLPPNPQINADERSYLSRYEDLCGQFDNMSPQQFIAKYPPNKPYAAKIDPAHCLYYDSMVAAFKMTADQIAGLKANGFVIQKNIPGDIYTGFGQTFSTVYTHDLPVFFTADAILDPVYRTYDDMLKSVETGKLIPAMRDILRKSSAQLQAVKSLHANQTVWDSTLLDAEVYLSVATALLDATTPASSDQAVLDNVNRIIAAIRGQAYTEMFPLFGLTKPMDFTQFVPRGHYTCDPPGATTPCPIADYFKCMMWLGRADCAFVIDSLRQFRDFMLIYDCMDKAGVLQELANFNSVITFFVGDMDGLGAEGVTAFETKSGPRPAIDSIVSLDRVAMGFRKSLLLDGCGNQFILSQAMWKDPDAARPALPAVAQVSGQRFILDSYLLGHTVEAYVKDRNVPKLEEVAFCLGNNAGLGIVGSDLTTYTAAVGDYKPLASRLGAMRTLFDQYPYWSHNLYTMWLDALRDLSNPLSDNVPGLMQSANWQVKQMNTQLASWAELRHNTLLYAKQSYTSISSCFYPDGYVEPYPRFYRKIGSLMTALGNAMNLMTVGHVTANFDVWKGVTDTLALISEQELRGEAISAEYVAFLNRMLVVNPVSMCGSPPYKGWYTSLYANGWSGCSQVKPCIADVHTVPPSQISPSDIVLHAGTGTAYTMIVMLSTNDTCGTLYAGPVSSFYQYDVTPMARKTDAEWVTILRTGSPVQPVWIEQFKR
jgi:hypothetical protein